MNLISFMNMKNLLKLMGVLALLPANTWRGDLSSLQHLWQFSRMCLQHHPNPTPAPSQSSRHFRQFCTLSLFFKRKAPHTGVRVLPNFPSHYLSSLALLVKALYNCKLGYRSSIQLARTSPGEWLNRVIQLFCCVFIRWITIVRLGQG